MSTTINKAKQEFWCTRAQYEARKAAGTLVIGAIYHITDDKYQVETIVASTDPTTSTEGIIGQQYYNKTNNKTYICSSISGSTYIWSFLSPVQDVKDAAGNSFLNAGSGNVVIPTGNGILGLLKADGYYQLQVDSGGAFNAKVRTYTDYAGIANNAFVSKGTLENVLDNETVRVDKSQSFTDTQKTQALTNIGAENTTNKTTILSSSSTDTQYPSAKATYDAVEDVREVAEGKTQTYVVSGVTNPAFNSQADTIVLDSDFTDIDGTTHTIDELKRSDNFLVTELDVPDRWVANIAYVGPAADTEGSSAQASTPTPENPVPIVSTTLKDAVENNVELRSVGTYKDIYTASNTLITRNVGIKVLDGTENFVDDSTTAYIVGAVASWGVNASGKASSISTHFIYAGSTSTLGIRFDSDFNINHYKSISSDITDLTTFKQWLAAQYAAGTPVTVIYPLETPTTETKQLYISSETPLAFLQKLETAKQKVVDVQVNGTTVVNPTTGVANVPIASQGTPGVIIAHSSYGLEIANSTGLCRIVPPNNSQIENKNAHYNPIVPSNLDKAVMEGLGNYNLGTEGANAWSDEYKSHAREVIGAGIPNTTKINETTTTTVETEELLTPAEYQARKQAGTLVSGVRYKIKGAAQEKLISGTNIKTLNNQSLLGSGNININTAVWGNITGTLSSQTDLQNALNAKSTVSASAAGTSTTEVSYLTINDIEYKLAGGGGSIAGAVRYDIAQSLTTAQKAQAKENIGCCIVEILEDGE